MTFCSLLSGWSFASRQAVTQARRVPRYTDLVLPWYGTGYRYRPFRSTAIRSMNCTWMVKIESSSS